MIPKGLRRKRARLWAALYVRLFGEGDTDESEEADDEDADEDGGDESDGEETER